MFFQFPQVIYQELGQAARSITPTIQQLVGRVLASLGVLLFPGSCLVCGGDTPDGKSLCDSCREGLLQRETPACPRCARPLPPFIRPATTGCNACRRKRPRFDQAVAIGVYGGLVREVVLRIKQPRDEPLCLAVGQLLGEMVQRELANDLPDLVIPVPMHWWRKWRRGVNDAELLAEAIARTIHRPCAHRILHSRRATRKQGTLLPDERKRNVRDAYGLSTRRSVRDQHLLLVDDVMTTGATLNELARLARQAGARRVTVAVVARGVGFE